MQRAALLGPVSRKGPCATGGTERTQRPLPPRPSTSHRSGRSELSVGEEIEEDLSVGLDDATASDKVRPPGALGAPGPPTG